MRMGASTTSDLVAVRPLPARAIEAGRHRIELLAGRAAALDPAHSLLALKTAKALSKAGASVLCILHDPNQAFRFADKVALLKDGKIFFEGSPSEAANACMLSEVYGADCKITSAPDGFPVAIFC